MGNREYSIAVDFDGTLCEVGWPGIGKPNVPMIELLKEMQRYGYRLILWTCRVGERLDEAIAWGLQQGLHFEAVNSNLATNIAQYHSDPRKIHVDLYLDDKACNGYDSLLEYFNRIKEEQNER